MHYSAFVAALLASALSFSVVAQSTVSPCGANDLAKAAAHAPEPATYLQEVASADATLEAFTTQWLEANSGAERVDVVIPVVFHIIHNNGPENISNEQVEDAIRVLNNDYNKLNLDWPNVRPEFLDLVADIGIEFRLAQRDPQGNCTNGITRTVSTLTNDGTQTMKALIQWPRNKYLNIWVAASADGAAGYTYRPGAVANWPEGDGIVLLHDYTGAIGTSSPSHSRTLTHEVGHWLNLSHTWGNTNDPAVASNCGSDDNVSDTPNTIGWTMCDLDGASCGNTIDNVENYMEYSYCSKMFTNGQAARMLAALNSATAQRNQLWTANNLASTGVSETPILCLADFVPSTTLVCAGTPVSFTDLSYHNIVSRSWSFPGATPTTSTDETPVITYAEPGVYAVSLTVSDGTSSLSTTQDALITVMANPGATPPVMDSFESISSLNGPEWYTVNSGGGNSFALTTAAAYTGSSSVRVQNSTSMDGITNELLSRTFDMSQATDITISYRWAYAKRTSTSDDVLNLQVSNDCGATWSLRKIMRGSTTLPTAPNTTGNFIPSGPDQWGYVEVSNISSTSHVSDFRFKFVFESDGGNNLYLDDVNVNGMPVGVSDLEGGSVQLQVLPNPVRDAARLGFKLASPAESRIDVIDATGRTVRSMALGTISGNQLINLPVQGLEAGTYLVQLVSGGQRAVSRFVME